MCIIVGRVCVCVHVGVYGVYVGVCTCVWECICMRKLLCMEINGRSMQILHTHMKNLCPSFVVMFIE